MTPPHHKLFNLLLAVVALASTSGILRAQDPSHRWLSLHTKHFYVTFTPPLEPLARRVAADAERAYAQLAAELTPPRGTVDIVISDDVDVSNGSATPIPTNRIIIYAPPPVSESALRYTNDWAQMVVTHELTHIFHLDRSRGVWSLAQRVFGRSPFLFPNFYAPSWLAEGLAVYYESRLAGHGRIEGPEHTLLARAAAADRDFPSLGDLSLAAPRFPYGETAYSYGSLFVDYLARTHGAEHVRSLIESESVQLVPYLLDIPAKHAFGVTFSRGFRQWRDSITRSVGARPSTSPLPGWRQLTNDGANVALPRWLSDSVVTYTGTPGSDVNSAYLVSLSGERSRIGRRNSTTPNVPLANGGLLFSQLEFRTPYQERSDLFVHRDGHDTRLTKGARLSNPDARADGAIVAVQIVPAGTRLVRVSADGSRIAPLTSGGFDEQWTEPRWSHRGDRVAAVRTIRGGIAQLVVIDTTGTVLHVAVSGEVVPASPAWLPDDAGLIFSLGRAASNEIVVDRFDGSVSSQSNGIPRYPSRAFALSAGTTGLYDPEPSPNGRLMVAELLRGDGYHLGVADCCAGGTPVDLPLTLSPDPRTPPVAIDNTASKRYSPWRTFYPRYWVPTIDAGFRSGAYRIGGTTYGRDVIGRHDFAASLLVPTDNTGLVGSFVYSYSGLGLPVIGAGASQDWSWFRDITERAQPKTPIGEIRRRVRDASVDATWIRQRVRTSFSFTAGVGVEQRNYLTVPDGLLPRIDTLGVYDPAFFPRLEVSAGFASYRSPPLSISPEDGVSGSVTLRERFRSGFSATGGASLTAVGAVSLYKSLDLGGFAHHVIALRGAAGWSDPRANGYFEIGGTSGSAFQIIPGYSVGEGRRTFGVRGFEAGSLIGIRALAASAEYRVPALLDRVNTGVLPFFLQRTSLSLWSDYGTAWCPNAGGNRQVCTDPLFVPRSSLASFGAEVNVLAGLLTWDSPYRFRFGIAKPFHTVSGAALPSRSFYLTSGISF